MKRLILLAAAVMCFAASASAQSWLEAVKKVAADVVDEATGGKLTAVAIVGTWSYKAPASRLDSSDALGSVSGALAGSALDAKMAAAFEKAGIKEGFCSITFNSDGTFSMPVKSKTVSGTYVFDASNHAITLDTGKMGSFSGYAYISGTDLQIVFPIDKLMNFVTTMGAKISALSSVTALLSQYENAYLGFAFAR